MNVLPVITVHMVFPTIRHADRPVVALSVVATHNHPRLHVEVQWGIPASPFGAAPKNGALGCRALATTNMSGSASQFYTQTDLLPDVRTIAEDEACGTAQSTK